MTEVAYWYIIKCLPELRRREPRNIGVMLERNGDWASLFLGQDRGTGEVNGRRIPDYLQLPADAFRSWVDYFNRKAGSGEWEGALNPRSGRPQRVYVERGGTILHPVGDLQAVVEELYDEIVGERKPPRAIDALRAEVDLILQAAEIPAVEGMKVDADYGGTLTQVPFDLGYRNGQLHLMECAGPSRLHHRYAREAWARMEGASRANSSQSFLVFYDSESMIDHPAAEEALSILDQPAITVDVEDRDEAVAMVVEAIHTR